MDDAWRGTSAEFKSMQGMEGLRGVVKQNASLRKPAEFVSFVPVTRNGLDMAECTFRTPAPGKTVKVLLAQEAGAWKVERMSVE